MGETLQREVTRLNKELLIERNLKLDAMHKWERELEIKCDQGSDDDLGYRDDTYSTTDHFRTGVSYTQLERSRNMSTSRLVRASTSSHGGRSRPISGTRTSTASRNPSNEHRQSIAARRESIASQMRLIRETKQRPLSAHAKQGRSSSSSRVSSARVRPKSGLPEMPSSVVMARETQLKPKLSVMGNKTQLTNTQRSSVLAAINKGLST